MTNDPVDDELADLDESRIFDWSLVDRSVLLHPIVVRAGIGLIVVLVFLLWPDRSRVGLTRLVGAVLLVVGTTTAWSGLRSQPRDLVVIMRIQYRFFRITTHSRTTHFMDRVTRNAIVRYAIDVNASRRFEHFGAGCHHMFA